MGTRLKKLKYLAIGMAIAALLTVIAMGIGYWFVVPKVAEDTLRARLATLERDARIEIVTERIEPDGIRGVKITNFKVIDPAAPPAHQDLLLIEELTVGIDRARLLAGDKVISSVDVHHASLNVHREDDGQINLERLIKTLRASRALRKKEEPVTDSTGAPGFLRHFGGSWPDLDVQNVQINFSSDHDKAFPLESMHMKTVQLDSSGTSADMETTITITPHEEADSQFVLPRSISTKGTLALPLEQSAMTFTFDRPFKIANLPFYPSLSVGLSNVELSKGGKVALTQITLEETLDSGKVAPLFDAEKAELRLEKFTTDPGKVKPLELLLLNPHAYVNFRADGGSNISDLLAKLGVQDDSPTDPARDAAPSDKESDEEPDPAQASSSTDDLLNRIKRIDLAKIANMLPHTIDIEGGSVSVTDAREHTLVRASTHLELRDGTLKLAHDAERGSLTLAGGFEARAGMDGQSDRGGASVDISGNYKTHMMKLKASARELDLSWLAQMGGSRAAKHLKGGVLRATFEIEQTAKGSPYAFQGDVAIEQGHLEWDRLAEEPLKDWSVGYDFKGYYDPNAAIPEAKLLKTALDANVPEDLDDIGKSKRRITEVPPTRGALVFTRGKARAGEARAEFTPALYGLARDKPLPARLDLGIKMAPTPIQSVLDAVPSALLGEIAGAKISGSVKMDFLVEVPLYDASNMVWRGEPETSNAEIISLPDAVDVRQMVQSFKHTIIDERVNYERHVRVPQMNLVPSQWLIENAGLASDQVDRHWGGWVDMVDGVAGRQSTWKTSPRPWGARDDARIKRYWKPHREGQTDMMVSDPYGPYVFVPLHHIAYWLPRAIFTTEDNSFFKHDGFNRLALRQSIERNLAEGDYARGASTISMQLIKNLYLTRKKVMARKIQEAILVWLTESVVRVPKARMLEVYLNIIEFGPGVFGIHDAAVHYFGKRPDELTLAECAWLVTIVPGPKKYHFHYARGEMSDRMFDRIQRYMKIMHNRNRVTEEELAEASLVKPTFNQPLPGAAALAPLPVVEQPTELEHMFPGLFGNPVTPTPGAPGTLAPNKGTLIPKRNPAPSPLFKPTTQPPGKARPDPAPPRMLDP